MNVAPEVAVTLDPDLFERLRSEAEQLGVPMAWLVASLVVDTFEGMKSPSAAA
jgi:hypothetical protein